MKKKLHKLVTVLSFLIITNITAQNFRTIWKTTTANESITIPTTGGGYNYTVDWGDGSVNNTQTANTTHVYDAAGDYTVIISGDFPRIYFNNQVYKYNIRSIEEWGSTIAWTSMEKAFYGCSNLVINATDTPNLANVSSLKEMFKGATSLGIGSATNWSSWNVGAITDMSEVFNEATSFNQDISSWNTSNVVNMSRMFKDANAFNQPLATSGTSWDVSNVTNMSEMFRGAVTFNQNISNWNTSNVINSSYMFSNANSFNLPINTDGSSWNVSNVTNMSGMFKGANIFNEDISSWNVGNVINMSGMFWSAREFNQNINSWNTSSVTDMSYMFFAAVKFNQNFDGWDVSNVIDMSFMFAAALKFNYNINGWNVGSVTNMRGMFNIANDFNQNIGNWNVSNVTDTAHMFAEAVSFNQDISSWNVEKVTTMSSMFSEATNFNQGISLWNTNNVIDMTDMFKKATNFNQNLGNWNVEKVLYMLDMFKESNLSTINYDGILEGWNTQTLKNGVYFSAGTTQYCSAAAQTARANMISTYNWTFTDGGLGGGCTALGIDDEFNDIALRVYPNPVTSILHLSTDDELTSIEVYSVLGKKVITKKVANCISCNRNKTTVDVSQLNTGIYILRITTEKEVRVLRILKK